MTSLSPIVIAAATALHFGLSPRDLAVPDVRLDGPWPWTRIDEARAISVYLMRRYTAVPYVRLARLFGLPGKPWDGVRLSGLESDVSQRMTTDDLLLFTVRDIEAEIEALLDAPASDAIQPEELEAVA